MPPIARPRGTNDLLPPDSALRAWVLDTHRQIAEAHGYELIDTPAFEATELYERVLNASARAQAASSRSAL
jgi:histidyl-tRNA synthetase